ncbi:peptidylprolyl isomerase [Pontibacter beigongshangensis]|uniref:peptidylprolyl isomerase n=1 Tax=Pontibacter beigongshangensis TaxID=2574733 RepID=UPI00164EE10F|nr:peptidylprolyl isomerase [Pontibacter beigongshangensis]
MKFRNYYIIIIAGVFLLASCRQQPQQGDSLAPALNKFHDASLVTIYTLQDERKTTDLLPYLSHPKPQFRKEAALAFASVQDTLALPPLLLMLSDTATAVREAAAFAIGQIGHQKAEDGLIQHLTQETQPAVQAALLEALGKLATMAGADYLATYNATNATAKAGQAWGLYRTGLRKLSSIKATELAVQLLAQQHQPEVRLAAAHYLARTPRIDLTQFRQPILNAATSDEAPEVRMALAQALAKIRTRDKAPILAGIAQSDPDYRVRINAIRAMAGIEDFKEIEQAVLAALQDKNRQVAVATAEFLEANARFVDAGALQKPLSQLKDERVKAGLMWVTLRNSVVKSRLSNQYRQLYSSTQNPYARAHLLKALSADYSNYQFIATETFAAPQPVVATYGIEALAAMRQQPDFPQALEQEFAALFKKAVSSGDVALTGIAAGVIREPKLNFRGVYQDISFLKQAQQKLQLPRDMETNMELQKTIDFLNGKTTSQPPQNPYTHPVNWKLVKNIPTDQLVTIRTGKGDIQLQLLVEDAPGTVANFVELTQQGFFNGLSFHRVVPNFVVQGGDKRGDGWGSSDYAIRSEFTLLRFREGSVGMASAGKDTESNQWFITHSPTPHLDGRYTIFAKVVQGMEVVHQLEVGDAILGVELAE